jgi:pyruvate carboxylase
VALGDPRIGIASQDSIKISGAAIQCRITTEDPLRDFAPDTGQVIAYRSAAGFGIRLDGGGGTAGAIITPYYDSLLVKLTAKARNLEQAAAKMYRSLSEFRIRGVRHNIPLLKNVVCHPAFLAAEMDTTFFEIYPELFKYPKPKDRATKLLSYLGDVIVNDPHKVGKQRVDWTIDTTLLKRPDPEVLPFRYDQSRETAKAVFDREGTTGLKKWIAGQSHLLLTDTTMRDAQQSLFATRLRTHDILNAAPYYRDFAHQFFSLEVWGGATFDTCLRFLKEDPWERLAKVRELVPNILLQMLLRGDNAVGYTNYPKWVIQEFIRESVRTGLDVFRIFDCLNQPDKMETAIAEVKKQGAIAEVCVCYTGNLADPKEQKYGLKYYTDIARTITAMGADILCIKDMAGLLRPAAVQRLVTELKSVTGLPIHLHTHDTAGVGVTMQLAAQRAGCDIIDGAVSSMAGLTSQPSLNALIAAMEGAPECPEVPLPVLDQLARYWEGIRTLYRAYDPGIKATSTDVYVHEIPGGQYSNLFEQAIKVGLSSEEFFELTKRYTEVNKLFGNIVKVTPSSKVVGDMALLLQKHGLTGETYRAKKPALDYPDSVTSFFKGHMGVPFGGFPKEVREMVLGPNAGPPEAPQVDEGDSLETVKASLEGMLGRPATTQEALSSRLYPKVFRDYRASHEKFGRTGGLPTSVFFYGLNENEEIETDLEPGMTLNISYRGISKANEDGKRTVFFNLNGFGRSIDVFDQTTAAGKSLRAKAEPFNDLQVGAPMPGKVLDIKVAAGDVVKMGDVLVVTEAMKMEYAITAKRSGTIKAVHVKARDQVDGGDLLVEFTGE